MFSITLTSHKTSIDEIDVTYYLCDIGECGYKAKLASSVKTRKALIHEIDVVYYPCNKCNYEAKEKSSLKKHKARIHGCRMNTERDLIEWGIARQYG